jgi:epoxide hydrolase
MTRSHPRGRQQPWSAPITRRQFATDAATAFVVMAAMPSRVLAEAQMAPIVPFKAHISDTVLHDLNRRLDQAKWPDQLPGTTWENGADNATMHALADYWRKGYNWRVQEAQINRFDQFTTEIDGQSIHFIHERSRRADAIPLMLLHGWPGSIVEFLAMINPLTRPTDPASPAFHVVVPSLPGFGFSGPTISKGWDPQRISTALIILMERLGYRQYGLQGGDWGARISQLMASRAPTKIVGLHSNFLIAPSPSPQAIAQLNEQERKAFLGFKAGEESGYFRLQETRPQTIAYALTDSPVGLLAWFGEKFQAWVDHDGDFLTVVDRDTFLTNLMLHWATGTVGSSMRIYREALLASGNAAPIPRFPAPVGQAIFPKELISTPDAWADQQFNIVQRTRMPRGGHFAALEQPGLLVTDIRALFLKIAPSPG